MPSSIEVVAAHGECLRLSESVWILTNPCLFLNSPTHCQKGALAGACGPQRWRWELSRREIYVLAAGDEFGLGGFVTRRKDQRLWLNTPHVVLAKEVCGTG